MRGDHTFFIKNGLAFKRDKSVPFSDSAKIGTKVSRFQTLSKIGTVWEPDAFKNVRNRDVRILALYCSSVCHCNYSKYKTQGFEKLSFCTVREKDGGYVKFALHNLRIAPMFGQGCTESRAPGVDLIKLKSWAWFNLRSTKLSHTLFEV